MTHYVLGFLFSSDLQHVILIRKSKPVWQHGLLNGVGGHVEAGEFPNRAMSREFYEETGGEVDRWFQFSTLRSNDWKVDCFYSVADPGDGTLDELAWGNNDAAIEPFCQVDVNDLHSRDDLIPNIPWLVHAALEQHSGVIARVEATYV